MSYEKYTKVAAGAPVLDVADARVYLNVDDDAAQNSLIQSLISGWTAWAEAYCWTSFNETEWSLQRDEWSEEIVLRKNPVKEVIQILYYDADDVLTVLPVDSYIVYQTVPAKIELLDFPVLNFRPDAVEVQFRTENLDDIEAAKLGIQSLVALQHLQREDFNPNGPYISIAKRLFSPIRLNYF